MRRLCIATVLGLWLLVDSAVAQQVDRATGAEHAPLNQRVDNSLDADVVVTSVPASGVVAQTDLRDDGPSLIPPVLTLVVGAAATVLGLGLGIGPVMSCTGHCEAMPWVGGLVVGGLAAMTAGLLWHEWVIEERHQLETHRRMLRLNALAVPTSLRWAF